MNVRMLELGLLVLLGVLLGSLAATVVTRNEPVPMGVRVPDHEARPDSDQCEPFDAEGVYHGYPGGFFYSEADGSWHNGAVNYPDTP